MPSDPRERLQRLISRPGTGQSVLVSRIIFGTFGFVFFGIGVSVIVFLWSQPFGEFGSPPLFFRVVGSFIALAFVAMGGGTAFAAVFGRPPQGDLLDAVATDLPADDASEPSPSVGYQCNHCGAPLAADAEVSPHGDVKCPHCDRWFNIHGRG